MNTRQEETPKTYIKSNTATVRGLMSFLSIVLLIIVAGLCAYVLIGYKGIRKNQNSNAREFNFRLENDTAVILEFYNYEATKCEIPATITGENNKIYPVTVLAETAFTNHGNLTEVKIPDSVTNILGNAETKKGAFSGCVNLQTVTMGKNVTNIGAYAFKNCIALQSIQIPSTVEFVEEGAFMNCLSLETVDLDSNGALAENCFENCLNVKTLDLSDDVELNLSARKAFAEMVKLTNIIISDTNTKYCFDSEASCLLTKTNEENDTLILAGCGTSIPASVTKIADWVWGKRAVDNLFVPDTVTDITENAFANQVIYTNASTIPERWFTPETVTIKTNAS
ncbi:MAG: leucine-rich repeat domain-containing protein, partial [Clostridia bacterium]|nr:leucine-rich repeat domain-containing protein [Clostridia bacterium]